MSRIPKHIRERSWDEYGICCTSCWNIKQGCWCLQNRFQQTGSTTDLPCSGRPRFTTRDQDRYIVNTHLRDRFLTAITTTTESVTRLCGIAWKSNVFTDVVLICCFVFTQCKRRNRVDCSETHQTTVTCRSFLQ